MPARPDWPTTRRLAWLYSPEAQRPLLGALFNIEREIGTSLAPGLAHEVAHARLAWWRDECARCGRGEAQHPLTRALAAQLPRAADRALAGLSGLIDTAIWDLASATFATGRELAAYGARWSGAFMPPVALIALPQAPHASVLDFGARLRELEMLCALAHDAHAGRIRVPLDELPPGARPGELASPPYTPELASSLHLRHRAARAALITSITPLGSAAPAALRGLMAWAALLIAQSRRAEHRLPGALLKREDHAPLDSTRAWWAARRAAAGRGPAQHQEGS